MVPGSKPSIRKGSCLRLESWRRTPSGLRDTVKRLPYTLGILMSAERLTIAVLLDRLEAFHGAQEPCWPTEPYLFLVWWHCGYPASDAACAAPAPGVILSTTCES